MKNSFSIDELSKKTNVNKATLRHWANLGLVRRSQNPSNGYYIYNDDAVNDVIVIVLFRNFGKSLTEIKSLFDMTDVKHYVEIYDNISKNIKDKIAQLNEDLNIITMQKNNIRKAVDSDNSIIEQKPPFDALFTAKNKLTPLDLTYKTTRIIIFNILKKKHIFSKTIDTSGKDKIAWRLDPNASYFSFMYKELSSGIVTNANNFIRKIQAKGFDVKNIFLKYLTTLPLKNDSCNYFEAWAEAYKNKGI